MVDYERVKGWTKASRLPAGKSVFDMQKLFIPINQGNVHWVLVVVDMNGGGGGGGSSSRNSSSAKTVSFFDSFGRDGTTYVEVSPSRFRHLGHRGTTLSEQSTAGIARVYWTNVDLRKGKRWRLPRYLAPFVKDLALVLLFSLRLARRPPSSR